MTKDELAMELWGEQYRMGIDPDEYPNEHYLDEWYANGPDREEDCELAAEGDVEATLRLRRELGLPVLV